MPSYATLPLLALALISSSYAQNNDPFDDRFDRRRSPTSRIIAGVIIGALVLIFTLGVCCMLSRRRRMRTGVIGDTSSAKARFGFGRFGTPLYPPPPAGGAGGAQPGQGFNGYGAGQYATGPQPQYDSEYPLRNAVPPPPYKSDHADGPNGPPPPVPYDTYAPPPGPPPPAHLSGQQEPFAGGFRP